MDGLAMEGFAIDGLAIDGFKAVTTEGFAIEGLAMDGFAIEGFAIDGLAIEGFAMDGFAMDGLAIDGLCVSAERMAGFVNPKLSGFRSCGALGSGLNVTNPWSPPGTRVPLGAVISCAFTVTLALGFDDCMNTAREMLACAPTVTSSDVWKLNCSSETFPRGSSWPFARAGWCAREIRKVLCAG